MPEPIFASVQCIIWPLQVHLHLSQINQSGVRTLPGEMQTLQQHQYHQQRQHLFVPKQKYVPSTTNLVMGIMYVSL